MKYNKAYIDSNFNTVRQLVLSALLFAIAIVLSIIENVIPSITIPGIKLGLSNIVVMYALFFLGGKYAYSIAVLKALFVLITRGMLACFLSFFGGILSVTIMLFLIILFKNKITYLIISIFGAVFHNLGQFIVVLIIYTYQYIWTYIPILLISGVVSGVATSTLLRFIMPAFKKLGLK